MLSQSLTAPRRERKKRAMREHLVQTARRLIAERGYWAATVEQIAAAADVAPATFFNYFPNKAAVLRELAGSLFESLVLVLEAERVGAGSTQERLERFFLHSAERVERAREFPADMLFMAMRSAAVPEGEADPLLRLERAFSAFIYEGQRRGDVRRDIEAAFLAELAVRVLMATLTSWLKDPRYPIAARARQASSFVGNALRADAAGVHDGRIREGELQ